MNELSTITCDDFNSPTYVSVCDQVCGGSQSGGTGGVGGGTGGTSTGGTGGTGGSGTGGSGTGGSGATACGTVEPCGGSPLGTWSLTSECLDAGELNLAAQQQFYCPQAEVASHSQTVSGSATFNTNMSFSLTENIAYSVTVSLPLSCTQGLSCADYGAYLAALASPGTSIACSGTSSCTCIQTSTEGGTVSGTYVLSGGDITLTNSTGSSSTAGFCVQGSTIHLITVDPTMHTGPGNQATISSDVIGLKQ
jgi:hypothetical protein